MSKVFYSAHNIKTEWNSPPHDVVNAQAVNLFKIDVINTGVIKNYSMTIEETGSHNMYTI